MRSTAVLADLKLIGISHETADLAARSHFALSSEDIVHLTRILKTGPGQEFLVLSTCNRLELYSVGIGIETQLEALSLHSRQPLESVRELAYLFEGVEAGRHLFNVASGLKSAALGENEILGQLKAAFYSATELGGIGKVLCPLMQRSFKVGKRVHTESELGKKGVSIASVASKRAGKLAHGLQSKRILIIGAGQMSESIVKCLGHHECRDVTVCSRTLSKTFALAGPKGFNAVTLNSLDEHLKESDIVFCAASVEEPLIDVYRAANHLKPGAVIVDLGVPGNVSTAVRSLSQFKIVDMEDLNQEIALNLAEVSASAPQAIAIVNCEVQTYVKECAEREASPSIANLVKHTERIRQLNLEWALSQIPLENERERKLLEDLSIRLTRGILSDPIHKLKHEFHDPDERAVLARFFQAER